MQEYAAMFPNNTEEEELKHTEEIHKVKDEYQKNSNEWRRIPDWEAEYILKRKSEEE
jgi:hypothetical protein